MTEETVHLHLEQRVAQRLLGRFRAQGFVHHDLSRACLAQVADSIPRVILLGRLSLYGRGPSGCTRRSSRSPRAGSTRATRRRRRCAPTPATPRRKSLELLDDALAEHRQAPADRARSPSGCCERRGAGRGRPAAAARARAPSCSPRKPIRSCASGASAKRATCARPRAPARPGQRGARRATRRSSRS